LPFQAAGKSPVQDPWQFGFELVQYRAITFG
jgi:hypothetical protein